MNLGEFTAIYCDRPQNFAWFLGAGASRACGLRTANDLIWDLKKRYYCREENQDLAHQDIQNEAIKNRIQDFMDSRGFPEDGAEQEYTTYFEKIFSGDRERQRRYIKKILSEENVTLTQGNRVFGALISSGLCRIVFTSNFDSVVEKSVAEVSGNSLAAYHIEGSRASVNALNNEEFPIYCKLHGDFRYDSLKNLEEDLAKQNDELSQCFINAGLRFGLVVSGYSGRDASIIDLFHRVLELPNPFPHGLLWTGMAGDEIPPQVEHLLQAAREKGVNAHWVEIETFDTLMLRLWRNIENRPQDLSDRVYAQDITPVSIPLPAQGSGQPLIRMNALPVLSMPQSCMALRFNSMPEWASIREANRKSEHRLILTKHDQVLCWGAEGLARSSFNPEPENIEVHNFPCDLDLTRATVLKAFFEDALIKALIRGRPLLARMSYGRAHLIVDAHSDHKAQLNPLSTVVERTDGLVSGVKTSVTDEHPESEQVHWAESLRVSLDQRDGKLWVLLEPDIWIWPPRARREAIDFLDNRRKDRLNQKHNDILSAWIEIIFGTSDKFAQVDFSPFDSGGDTENPRFTIARRTAYTKRSAS